MTLKELFEEHHASLFRFVSRMTGDPDYAKDVVQETYLIVAAKPLPPHVPPRAGLFRIAQNVARSGLRKRRRRWALLSRGGSLSVPGPAPSPPPDVAVSRRETRESVRRALALLTEKERTILLMREEGFTHREIAEAVGTTTGSVGTMLVRALAKLEDLLGEAWREAP